MSRSLHWTFGEPYLNQVLIRTLGAELMNQVPGLEDWGLADPAHSGPGPAHSGPGQARPGHWASGPEGKRAQRSSGCLLDLAQPGVL